MRQRGSRQSCLLTLVEKLAAEGRQFRPSTPKFPRSSVHNILKDRAYIGEIEYRGQWYPGKQEPLVDRATWDRVQGLLGGHIYQSHDMTFAGQRMVCGHCGHPISGETKSKMTKAGMKQYNYYRCVYYHKGDHPRIRVREADLDAQVLGIFAKMRIDDKEVYATKRTQLRDRLASIKLQRDALDRSHDEIADLASRVFELSQTLTQKWVTADVFEKRRILEIVFLNCTLVDVSLVPTIRKPFDVLAEGLVSKNSRGDKI